MQGLPECLLQIQVPLLLPPLVRETYHKKLHHNPQKPAFYYLGFKLSSKPFSYGFLFCFGLVCRSCSIPCYKQHKGNNSIFVLNYHKRLSYSNYLFFLCVGEIGEARFLFLFLLLMKELVCSSETPCTRSEASSTPADGNCLFVIMT